MPRATLKKFLAFLGVIAASFFVLDRTLALGLQALLKQSEFRFARLYQGGIDTDIVVLGNSRAVNAFFAPEMEKTLGKEVFHLAYNGMSMEVAYILVQDFLEHNEPPEFLILEVTNLTVPNGLLKDLKLFSGISERLRHSMGGELPILKAACDMTHLYRFNGELFLRCLFYLNKSDQSWINSGQIDSEFAASYAPSAAERGLNLYPTDGPNWEALMRIIYLCERQNIELKLVATPYLPNFRQNLPDYDLWVKHFRNKLPDPAIFFDFTGALSKDDYFADVLHLNKIGGIELLHIMIRRGGVFGHENSEVVN